MSSVKFKNPIGQVRTCNEWCRGKGSDTHDEVPVPEDKIGLTTAETSHASVMLPWSASILNAASLIERHYDNVSSAGREERIPTVSSANIHSRASAIRSK